jgi:DNA-binding beta-propeller fold protein YncE
VARIPLPGGNSRFDYASLDPGRGLLFVAHLDASQVAEINIRTGRVVRTIPDLPQVHGVLVIPALHRVYATATAADLVVRINEGTAHVGVEPDVEAYDPRAGRLYVASESGYVSVLQLHGHRLQVIYSNYLADDAHVVALDPATGRSYFPYFPVLGASGGHPAVLVCEIN